MTSPFQTEADLLAGWLQPYTSHTQRTYQTDFHRFQSTIQKSLRDVTPSDLQRFQETLQALHTRSQTRIMATLSSLFRFAFRERFLPDDPTRGLFPPKLPVPTEPKWLSEDQLAQLVATASSLRNQVLLILLYETGLTVGEVCRLQWNQVQYEEEQNAWLMMESPQGHVRQLPLPAHVRPLLQKLKESQGSAEFVFHSSRSTSLHSSQVFRIVRAMGQKANLPEKISPSWLRHSYARRALGQGMSMIELQYRLGHTTLHPTLRYLLTSPDGNKEKSSASAWQNVSSPSRHS